MLDDVNILKQRDSQKVLTAAANFATQASYEVTLRDAAHDGRDIHHVVIAGMGGSALAADIVKSLLARELTIPLEVVKGYTLPRYVNHHTLVIASSHSGNTEETVSCLTQALERHDNPQVAVVATGGTLDTIAQERSIMAAIFPGDTQPRMGLIYNLKCLIRVLQEFGVISRTYYDAIGDSAQWLREESDHWTAETKVEHNFAKQLALMAVGKTPIFYASSLMAPMAYKWKISWNENAKNLAFWNYLPEFNHNEFLGWTSHPIEKPFVVFDLMSSFDHPRVKKRFDVTDRMLSGRRPKAFPIDLRGETPLRQMLWGSILADFASIYVAILNNVDPAPVELIEKFKKELNS